MLGGGQIRISQEAPFVMSLLEEEGFCGYLYLTTYSVEEVPHHHWVVVGPLLLVGRSPDSLLLKHQWRGIFLGFAEGWSLHSPRGL